MTDRELMQQALEALEEISGGYSQNLIVALRDRLAQPEQEQNSTCNKALRAEGKGYPRTCRKCGKGPCIADRMEPEQTQLDVVPDAFNEWWNADYDDTGNPYRKDSPAYWAWSGWKAASKQPEQEPVAWIQPNHLQKARQAPFLCRVEPKQRDDFVPFYTTPPQRKPLTDEEIARACVPLGWAILSFTEVARAIEAAHGIKGEA